MRLKLKLQAADDLFKRYQAIFQHAWKNRRSMAGPGYTSEEARFLPAALSLQERPLSPAPHFAMGMLITFALMALLWAIFGRIDVVATAQGKVVPNDRVKTIQPLERSMVRAIHVTDGQSVKAGQVLVEFDASLTGADQHRAASDLAAVRLQVWRAKSMLHFLDSGQRPTIARPSPTPDDMWIDAQSALAGQINDHTAKRARVAADILQREAEIHSTQVQVRKLEQTLPLAIQREQDYQNLLRPILFRAMAILRSNSRESSRKQIWQPNGANLVRPPQLCKALMLNSTHY